MPQLDYAADPTLQARVFRLLDVVFPGLAAVEQALRPWGLDWCAISTPYVVEREGRVLSHVGLIELEAELDGEETRVGSIHAVATHPDERRRGHYRRLIEELLRDTEGRYRTLWLTTANPEFYEPFGFRHVPEHRFLAELEGPPQAGPAARELDLSRAPDRELLLPLLDGREPISARCGVARERAAFLVNAARRPLAWLEDAGAVVAYEREGATLRIRDVVPRPPAQLDALVAPFARRAPVERVELYFSPDRIEGPLRPEPFLLDGDDHLMVHGPFPEGPLMLPPTLRT